MIRFYWLIIIFLFFTSCTTMKKSANDLYIVPQNKDDGFRTALLSEVGIDHHKINNLLKAVKYRYYKNIHALVIVKDGAVVLDEIFKERLTYIDALVDNKDIELHAAMSVTKSIVSIAMGIALDDTIITNIDAPVYPYFPEYESFQYMNEAKSNLTIKNFLTMCHGLQWDESSYSYSSPKNSWYQMDQTNDWVKFTLDLEIVDEPGTVFSYSSGVSHTIEALIANAAGTTFSEFVDEKLFGPLGITKTAWIKAPNGRVDDVYLTARDMAKIGQLCLDGGNWNGVRLVSADWINESTAEFIRDGKFGYAYFWWKYNFEVGAQTIEATIAWGYGGQYIFIFPQLNMVTVFTSGNYDDYELEIQPFTLLEKYILPAVIK